MTRLVHLVPIALLLAGCGDKKRPDENAASGSSAGAEPIENATYKDVPSELTDARIEQWLKAMVDPTTEHTDELVRKFGFKDEAEFDLVNNRIFEITGEVMAAKFSGRLADKHEFSYSKADVDMVRKHRDRIKVALDRALESSKPQ